ncbi:hypothetical protein QEG73_00045 [Chitinophagaceae bacterium 26-R-25]|nr:hypothetical protein [Chitinophagaceae bacterium 26-R-25]
MMNKLIWTLLLAVNFISDSCYSQNESSNAIMAMKKAIGSSIDKYTTYSQPTTNFGVGTACRNKWVPRGAMLCDMVSSYGLDTVKDENLWKSVNGFAFYGNVPGPLTLTDTIANGYGLALLLPKIFKVLNINVGVKSDKTKSVQLTIDSAVIRYLNYDKFKSLVNSGRNTGLADAYRSNRLVVATSDYVLLNYTLQIALVDTFGVAVAAKLDSLLKITENFSLNGQDSLGFSIKHFEQGTYKISSNKPVVFAIYTMKQKNFLPQGAEKVHDFKDPNSEFESVSPDYTISPPKDSF